MKHRFNTEENIKFLQKRNSTLYFLCMLTGILTGITVSLYRYGLHYIEEIRVKLFTSEQLSDPIFLTKILLVFIVFGLITDYITKKLPTISGSGIPQVKAIILRQLEYKTWLRELGGKFLGGLLGIGAGLSLGREGPSVQLGSYIGYGVSEIFQKNEVEKKYLVTSGASAGLSGAFGAPLAGVLFSLEELHKHFSTRLLICTLMSSVLSDFVGRRIFGVSTAFNFKVIYPMTLSPYLQFTLFIIFGIIIAFFGKIFTMVLIKTQNRFKKNPLPRWIKICFIMILSFVLCFVFPEVTGGGHPLAEELAVKNSTIKFLIILFIVKLIFTALSYSTSFPGGIFLPMLVLGAILGKIYSLVLIKFLGVGPEYMAHYMVLGMAAYFVAVVRAPITGIVLILEMTGTFEHLLALATVSLVAYYITEIMKVEPIYDILYRRLDKNILVPHEEPEEEPGEKKTVILIPVSSESYLDSKKISQVHWPKGTLVVGIQSEGTEKIPNGSTIITAGDKLLILMSEKRAKQITAKLHEMGTENHEKHNQ